MIVDTSFLIDLMRKNKKAIQKLEQIEHDGIELVVPTPVIFELFIGISMSKFPEKENKKIINVLSNLSIVSFNYADAKLSGIILGTLYTKGSPIDPVDTQIAIPAMSCNMSVLTRNLKHFKRIKNLKVETY